MRKTGVKKSLEKPKNDLEQKRENDEAKIFQKKRHTFTMIASNFVREQLSKCTTSKKFRCHSFLFPSAFFYVKIKGSKMKTSDLQRGTNAVIWISMKIRKKTSTAGTAATNAIHQYSFSSSKGEMSQLRVKLLPSAFFVGSNLSGKFSFWKTTNQRSDWNWI